MFTALPVTRALRGAALFGTGVLLTLACTRVKVTWDQAASAAAPGVPAIVAPALPPPSATQVADAKVISRTFTQVAEQMAPSVVSIHIEKKQKGMGMVHGMRNMNPFQFFGPFGSPFGNPFGDDDNNNGNNDEDNAPVQRGAGSGVVIDAKGMILTNNHVVGGADSIKVKFNDGKELPAKIVGTDPRSDLAVIKVDTSKYPVKPARLGDSDKMLPGEWVIAIGNPFGLDHTVTVGVISAKGRSGINHETHGYEDFLQTDASINPGNSGGPLVNLNGEVIGINTAILGPGGNIGIGFAVPSDLAKPVVAELLATGKVRRPYVGISMQEMTAEMARAMGAPEKGALVQAVVPGGPADKAGIRRGDVIVSVDGKKIDTTRDVQRQVFSRKIGDEVSLGIFRDGKNLTIGAKAAEMPSDEALAQGGGEEQYKAKAKLGLSLQTLTPNLAERLGLKANGGVVVAGVKSGSPAAEVGLARGDVILEVDRRPVKTAEEAVQLLTSKRPEGHFLLVQKGDNAFYLTLPPE